MSRLMSVAFTEQAVVERRKTVTRRKGWWLDKRGRRLLVRGDRLTLCRKVMGRKPGEPLVCIADVEVVSVRREPLCAIAGDASDLGAAELAREGFLDIDTSEFMARYFTPQGIGPMDDVTRIIEWRYLDELHLVTVIPALRAPIDVVYKQATDSDFDLNRTAEAALLAGRETIIHRHAYETRKPHSSCAFWVLDWHDEPEYVGLHQVIVIAPPAVI